MIDLATLIAHVESNNSPFALRFEPLVMNRAELGKWDPEAERARAANKCSHSTARMIVSTSWGAWQIMGFNLYGPNHGLTFPVGQFLAERPIQETAFEIFVGRGGFAANADVTTVDFLKFAAFYNGPGEPVVYAGRMKQVLAQLTAA